MGRVISAIPGKDTKISLVNRTIKFLCPRVYFFDEVLLIFCRQSGKEGFESIRMKKFNWLNTMLARERG